jgi:hypothetical protein
VSRDAKPRASYVFSAKGAAFSASLGQCLRLCSTQNASAESAIHSSIHSSQPRC